MNANEDRKGYRTTVAFLAFGARRYRALRRDQTSRVLLRARPSLGSVCNGVIALEHETAALTDHYACVVEPDRLTPGAIVTLARHHVPDDMRRYIYNPSYIAHEECLGEYRVIVDAIARQSPTAPAIPMPIDRYGALRCATDQWFRDRSAAIDALCLAEAERLLAEREVAA